jgi:hypothetical protein
VAKTSSGYGATTAHSKRNIQKAALQVVRLKGGCPSLFSRAASEIVALASAGVSFELVPGVTSASAAAADASIPLTGGANFAAVAVISAHKVEAVAWVAYGPAVASTLIVLMGGRVLHEVVAGCLAAGWPECTRVCAAAACTAVLLLPWCLRLLFDGGNSGFLATPAQGKFSLSKCGQKTHFSPRQMFTARDCASLAQAMHSMVGLGLGF